MAASERVEKVRSACTPCFDSRKKCIVGKGTSDSEDDKADTGGSGSLADQWACRRCIRLGIVDRCIFEAKKKPGPKPDGLVKPSPVVAAGGKKEPRSGTTRAKNTTKSLKAASKSLEPLEFSEASEGSDEEASKERSRTKAAAPASTSASAPRGETRAPKQRLQSRRKSAKSSRVATPKKAPSDELKPRNESTLEVLAVNAPITGTSFSLPGLVSGTMGNVRTVTATQGLPGFRADGTSFTFAPSMSWDGMVPGPSMLPPQPNIADLKPLPPVQALPSLPDDDDQILSLLSTYFGPLFLNFPVPIRSELLDGLARRTVPDFLMYCILFWVSWYSLDLPVAMGRRRHRELFSVLYERMQASLMPSLEVVLTGYDAYFAAADVSAALGTLTEEELRDLSRRKLAFKERAVAVVLSLIHLLSMAMLFKKWVFGYLCYPPVPLD